MLPWICARPVSPSLEQSNLIELNLPSLDCHAHISPDASDQDLAALQGAVVFGVSRSLDESERVVNRIGHTSVVWGCGVHPGATGAVSEYDHERMLSLLDRFCLVGEIGLDKRAPSPRHQANVFKSILLAISGRPVLVSIHSNGCVDDVLTLIRESPHPGLILHWFLGDEQAISRATRLGCYFSVNAAMPSETLVRIPFERMLPETDFPAIRRRGGASAPGDTSSLEERVGQIRGESPDVIRRAFYRNLRALSIASGAIERLPSTIADRLLSV